MGDKLPGPQLVEAARKGTLNLDDLVGNPTLKPIHVSAILGTIIGQVQGHFSEALTSASSRMDAVVQRTGYRGFVPDTSIRSVTSPGSPDQTASEILYSLVITHHGGITLAPEKIEQIVNDYVSSKLSDEHMAAILGAVMVRGMRPGEIVSYTKAIWQSGKTLDFSDLRAKGYTMVDKHSTGGLADSVSLVLAPLVAAACPMLRIPMMSGRGLGHTGGTLDKLETIPGYRVQLTEDQIKRQLADIGVAIFAQTPELAPADGKIYALRDAVNCVAETGLIVGSILGKKLAEGTDVLVMDTKTGSGAFLVEYAVAKQFAQTMCDVGTANGLRTSAFITNMDQPLGHCAGNKLEVIEAIEFLTGHWKRFGTDPKPRFMQIVYRLAQEMITLADPTSTETTTLQDMIGDGRGPGRIGRAYEKFLAMVEAQGGDRKYVERISIEITNGSLSNYARIGGDGAMERIKRLIAPEGNLVGYYVYPKENGYLQGMRLTDIGEAIRALGAGRYAPTDTVNPDVGAIFTANIGDEVRQGTPLALVLHDGKTGSPEAFDGYFTIDKEPVEPPKLIRERVMAKAA